MGTLPDIGYKLGSWHDIKYYVLALNPLGDDMPEPLEYRQMIKQLQPPHVQPGTQK